MKFNRDNFSSTQVLFKAIVFDEYDDLEVPALMPKIEEIKKNITIFKEWFISESKKVNQICNGKNQKENYQIWALWCKKNVVKQLIPIYLLMVETDSLLELEKKLEFLAVKDNGYNTFKKFLKDTES